MRNKYVVNIKREKRKGSCVVNRASGRDYYRQEKPISGA